MDIKILKVGGAVPERSFQQKEVLNALGYAGNRKAKFIICLGYCYETS